MFSKLLVPLDGSPLAEQALGLTADIARAARASIDLVLVHDPLTFAGFEDAPWESDCRDAEQAYLDKIASRIRATGRVSTSAVMVGDPAQRIVERGRDVDADLIVMTSHGRTGLSRVWLGSVANGVLRHATAPVLVVRPSEAGTRHAKLSRRFKRILVTLDGSPRAEQILRHAEALARYSNATLVLLRVVQPALLVMVDPSLPINYGTFTRNVMATEALVAEAKAALDDVAARLAGDGFTNVETAVVVADVVAPAILDFATDTGADAIAMATRGRGVSRPFIGSVTDKVMRASDVPMLLVRPMAMCVESPVFNADAVASQLPALAGR